MAKPAASVSLSGGARRCQCGCYPTSHMRTAPVAAGLSEGGFRLVADGPCRACGEARCSRFVGAP